jgi:hypothetical protein
MKILMLAAACAAACLAPSASASQQGGAFHATKECSGFTGDAGSYCKITSSNVAAVAIGTKVLYLQPNSVFTPAGSAVILEPPGRGFNAAFGNCSLAVGQCTFWGGIGTLRGFHASVAVTSLGGLDWGWDGTYSLNSKTR